MKGRVGGTRHFAITLAVAKGTLTEIMAAVVVDQSMIPPDAVAGEFARGIDACPFSGPANPKMNAI